MKKSNIFCIFLILTFFLQATKTDAQHVGITKVGIASFEDYSNIHYDTLIIGDGTKVISDTTYVADTLVLDSQGDLELKVSYILPTNANNYYLETWYDSNANGLFDTNEMVFREKISSTSVQTQFNLPVSGASYDPLKIKVVLTEEEEEFSEVIFLTRLIPPPIIVVTDNGREGLVESGVDYYCLPINAPFAFEFHNTNVANLILQDIKISGEIVYSDPISIASSEMEIFTINTSNLIPGFEYEVVCSLIKNNGIVEYGFSFVLGCCIEDFQEFDRNNLPMYFNSVYEYISVEDIGILGDNEKHEFYFQAETEIVFKPGVEIKTGTYAYAYIHDCVDVIELPNGDNVRLAVINENEFLETKNYKLYPNPFQNNITIEYPVLGKTNINLSLYNFNGQLIKVLCNKKYDVGTYKFIFNTSSLPNGSYLLKLQTEKEVSTQKIIKL